MQSPPKKMVYPDKKMLQVRDCTVSICAGNNPGAVLLSTFLFWYDNPRNGDYYEDGKFICCRTQSAIEEQSCHQIDVKTIHNTAVPLLQLFSYLTVKEKMGGNIYILDMERIFAAYAAYKEGKASLKAFLLSCLQLESVPIEIPESQLELVLINRSRLYLQLERVLIANREHSNCKRGRKPRTDVAPEAQNEAVETFRDPLETRDKRDIVVSAIASTTQSKSQKTKEFPQGSQLLQAPTVPNKAETGKPPRGGKKPKVEEPPPVYKADKAALRELINQGRRGHKLIEVGDIIQENRAIDALAQEFTLEQLARIHEHMQKHHKYWSQPGNKYRIGGVAMAKDAPSIICLLEVGEELQLPPDTRTISSFDAPGYDLASEFYPPERERGVLNGTGK